MRRGYTLIEIIITVAITGILSVGMFKAFEAITTRSEKAKILTTLSIDSQTALDQLSLLLYNRVPVTLKEEDASGNWNLLDDNDTNFVAIEWYGTASESYNLKDYSGFVDIFDSYNSTHTLMSPDTNMENVLTSFRAKWNNSLNLSDMALIFSGTFDDGDDGYPYTIDDASSGSNIIISNPRSPMNFYEKYYLVDSAYAVARGVNIKQDAQCIKDLDLNISSTMMDNTLFLFYDYRPWKTSGKHYCADLTNPDITGKASVLTMNANDFRASNIDNIIRIKLNMYRALNGGNPTRISKQKVVF